VASVREMFQNKSPLLRGVAYILGALLLLYIVLQGVAYFFADDYAAHKLRTQLQKIDAPQRIEFNDLNLNLLSGSATLCDIRIKADATAQYDRAASTKPPILFKGTVNELKISNTNIFSMLWKDKISIGKITIKQPNITAIRHTDTTKSDRNSFNSIDSAIYGFLPSQFKAIEVEKFSISDGQSQLITSGDTTSSLHRLDLTVHDIYIDSASATSERLFPTDEISFSAQDFRIKLPDSLNIIAFKRLNIESSQQNIILDSLQLIPRYGKQEFVRRHGSPIDRIELVIPVLSINHFNFSALADSGKFFAANLSVDRANLKDYMNRSIEGGPPKYKPMPFITFRDLKYPIKLDSLTINNSFIAYSEYEGNTPKAGTVTFEHLNAIFKNISNLSTDSAQGLTTTLDAQAQVMGSGKLETHFEFPMNTKNAFHKVEGQLGAMPIADFNRMMKYVAFLRVDKGKLNNLKFEMTLNNDQSSGTLVMDYEDLKVSVLDRQSAEQKGLTEDIKSFFVNSILVKKANTPKSGMDAGQINFERAKDKSIFNYWWKSLLSGIKDTDKK